MASIKNSNSRSKYDSRLLRKKYPHGKHGYWLKFYVNEFWEAIESGNPKKLHIHVVFKKSGGEYLKIGITHDRKNIEVIRPKTNKEGLKGDAKKVHDFVWDELDNIIKEI